MFDSDTILIDYLKYPKQHRDVSFGRERDGSKQMCFFHNPTPKLPNNGGDRLANPAIYPEFSASNGFYDSSITVELTCSGEGSIYYTTDGKEPTIVEGIPYSSPIIIDSTTVLRARVIQKNMMN